MIYGVYCIRDNAAQVYLSPVLEKNDVLARRNFENACYSGYVQNQVLGTHPQDFSLYKIAEFDDEKGLFDAMVPAVLICSGTQALYTKVGGKDEVS